MDMRRYLLVLDMDLLAMDQEHNLEPINYLAAKQEQEPCEVVVLSLVDTSQTKLPAMELTLGAVAGKFPVAPKPDHDISAAAENRMDRAVRHLKTIGCQASGVISDQDLVKAVRSETASHDYDEVVLATGRQEGSGLARIVGRDPVQQLRHKWGDQLIVFPGGHSQESSS
jgi:chemotaxis response regulator CheB